MIIIIRHLSVMLILLLVMSVSPRSSGVKSFSRVSQRFLNALANLDYDSDETSIEKKQKQKKFTKTRKMKKTLLRVRKLPVNCYIYLWVM